MGRRQANSPRRLRERGENAEKKEMENGNMRSEVVFSAFSLRFSLWALCLCGEFGF
jgi:hypothetical protein